MKPFSFLNHNIALCYCEITKFAIQLNKYMRCAFQGEVRCFIYMRAGYVFFGASVFTVNAAPLYMC